ncbi:MAG: NAD-dependent epimerase/dehydratase family protein [Gammaproteobacteria bacterium]|nr:MAG: NAD-dependent epimerase/dehydratase family protein [Gammaproteobacteria bacterium]
MRIAVTGANSSVGCNLLGHVADAADVTAIACARSAKALATLPAAPNVETALLDYADHTGLVAIVSGADAIVHLAGVLFEGQGTSYTGANVDTTAAVVAAARAANVGHVVFISALGAAAGSANGYFRSKGEAEDVVLASGLKGTIMRTPMLLGPGSAAANALVKTAQRKRAFVLGGGRQMLRPLDLDDLSRAILLACEHPPAETVIHELTGPEALTQRALMQRVAAMLGHELRIVAVPIWSARLAAGLMRRIRGSGVSPAVIDVITAAEQVDRNADADLGLTLTPLEDTLRKFVTAA